jgi:ribosomal protein L37AE/L43A
MQETGCTAEEAGAMYGVPPATLRSRRHRSQIGAHRRRQIHACPACDALLRVTILDGRVVQIAPEGPP